MESVYSGSYNVIGITSTTTFSYDLERNSREFLLIQSGVSYKTNSKTATGGVSEIEFTYNGSNYSQIVGVSSIS